MFTENNLAGMELANRFVRSATYEAMATDDGYCTSALTDLFINLVKGEVGLIISGDTFVAPDGQARAKQSAIYSDDFIPALQQMTAAVHAADGKIVMQLAHCGPNTSIKDKFRVVGPNEATLEDIARTTQAFAAAASRAKQAGFDGIQIHAAHGYLLSQFLSPHYNKRDDEYGGSVADRARLVLEVLAAIREQVGQDYPVIIKINATDHIPGGMTAAEMVETCKLLEQAGIDAVEMSGGTADSKDNKTPIRKGLGKTMEQEVYHLKEAKLYKQKIKVPLMLVGGTRTFASAKYLLENNIADYISLSRPLIREPGLVKRWQESNTTDATCISCNGCLGLVHKAEPVRCVLE